MCQSKLQINLMMKWCSVEVGVLILFAESEQAERGPRQLVSMSISSCSSVALQSMQSSNSSLHTKLLSSISSLSNKEGEERSAAMVVEESVEGVCSEHGMHWKKSESPLPWLKSCISQVMPNPRCAIIAFTSTLDAEVVAVEAAPAKVTLLVLFRFGPS